MHEKSTKVADVCTSPIINAPRIGAEWSGQGGVYAGIMRGEDGKPDYHLIVPTHPAASNKAVSWGPEGLDQCLANHEFDGLANTHALCISALVNPAAEWAASIVIDGHSDFYLPARRELSLLFANVPELFEKTWHWSSTQHASISDYAWGQGFGSGDQDNDDKSYEGRARAVRRLIIQ